MKTFFLLAGTIATMGLSSCSSDNATDKLRAGDALVDSLLGDIDAAPRTSAGGDARLNPPHGEPGHRCEIPVGAPLDSEPGDYVEPNLSVTPTLEPPAPKMEMPVQPEYDQSLSPAEMLAQGLNPPHGEAGHKCEIPVGAPLK